MKIVIAEKKHLPVIRQIAYDTWFVTYSEIQTQEQLEYMLDWMYSLDSLEDQIKNKGHYFLLVELDGEYIGYASYELNYQDEPKTKIHKLYVLPHHHKKGVGQLLIEKIAEIAKKELNIAILLDVNKQNKAVAFYKRIGFEIVGEKCTDIGRGFEMDDYILEKTLNT